MEASAEKNEHMELAICESNKTEESLDNIEEEEEGDSFFQDIDLLTDQQVSSQDVKLLKKCGINTIKGLQMTVRKKLLCIKGFNEQKVDLIKQACCKISVSDGFVTALDVCDQRKQVFKLTTGSKSLDNLLGGGVESMAITEIFGEFGTGKTQIAHTLCITAQMPGANNYMGGKVIFIDTEHTFRPERLRAISDRFDLDQTSALENVLYARAYNSEHQFELLNNVAAKFHDEPGMFKLLIIDSIIALFRIDYIGRGEIADKQTKLGQMMSCLQKISEEYNVAVLITNQITNDYKNMLLLSDMDQTKPTGGNALAFISTNRVALRKGKGNTRVAKIYDSPDLEENEVMFAITNGGIDDPPLDE